MRLFLTLALIGTAMAACPTAWDLDHSSCDLFVSYNDAHCNDFTFDHCQWTECTSWSTYYDSDGYSHTSCDHYTTFTDPNWYGCTIRCCNPAAVYPTTSDGIKSCQAWLDAEFKRKLILGLSIFFGLLGLILIIILTFCCYKKRVVQNIWQNSYNCRACLRHYLMCRCLRRRPVTQARSGMPLPIQKLRSSWTGYDQLSDYSIYSYLSKSS